MHQPLMNHVQKQYPRIFFKENHSIYRLQNDTCQRVTQDINWNRHPLNMLTSHQMMFSKLFYLFFYIFQTSEKQCTWIIFSQHPARMLFRELKCNTIPFVQRLYKKCSINVSEFSPQNHGSKHCPLYHTMFLM